MGALTGLARTDATAYTSVTAAVGSKVAIAQPSLWSGKPPHKVVVVGDGIAGSPDTQSLPHDHHPHAHDHRQTALTSVNPRPTHLYKTRWGPVAKAEDENPGDACPGWRCHRDPARPAPPF